MLRVVKNVSPAEGEQGDTLPAYFSSCCKQASFPGLLGATFICVLFVRDSLFQMVPEGNGNTLFSVPKCRKAVMCFWRKRVLEKLRSGTSYSAVVCECHVNKSTVCIKCGISKQKHT